jgi:hypothetical protein
MSFAADLHHRLANRVMAGDPAVVTEPPVERRQTLATTHALALAAEAFAGSVLLEADGAQGRQAKDRRVEQRIFTAASHASPQHCSRRCLAQETGASVVARPARRRRRILGRARHQRDVEQLHEAKYGAEAAEAGLYSVPDARRTGRTEERRRRRRRQRRGRRRCWARW